jgi:hypothetical protein
MDDVTLLSWIDRGRTLAYLLVAVGVVGEFLVDRVSGPIIKRRDEAQRAEIARLTNETERARESAAKAEAQATSAGEGTAKALANAAGANERASKLELEAAQQRERAAKAEHDLLELQQRMAPRHISPAQATKLSNDLKPLVGKRVAVFIFAGMPENETFGNELASALKKVGLQVDIQPGMRFGGAAQPGISLAIGKNRFADANILANAFADADIAPKPVPAENAGDDDTLQIFVAPR